MLPLCVLLLIGGGFLPTSLRAAPTREIKVGTRWPQLIAANGKVFRNVKFTFVSPREVRFMHTDGIGSLPVADVVVPDNVELPTLGQDMPPELTMGPLGSMMTPQERIVSGIDKLSNDEQATLAQWVRNTVQDQLKEELERRGLPPTFTALPTIAEGAAASGLGTAPAAATSPLTSSSTQVMAAAPGKTYVPPQAPSATLLPPPGSPPPVVLVPGPVTSPPTPFTAASASVTARPSRVRESDTSSYASSGLLPPPLPGTLATAAGGRQVKARAGVVESSIDGEFRGLDAGRQFRLINGQTWQQQETFAHDHLAYKPRVTIYPANDGWMMAVDGVDKAVRVTPLN